jgi:hypothetical protein
MSVNPMHEARTALAAHLRCEAHCRTIDQPCRNPAMVNGRCRMRGGNNRALRGPRHPNFKHGRRTIETQDERHQVRCALLAIRELLK